MTESAEPSAKPDEWWESEWDDSLQWDVRYPYEQLPSVSGDDVVLNIDGRVVVQAGHVEGRPDAEPFVVCDTHTAYEWAVLLDDRHPYHPWWYTKGGVGVADKRCEGLRTAAIEFTERAEAIFEALVAAHESGRIEHVRAVWYERPPTQMTLCRFRRDDVLKVLSDLGAEDGIVLQMLLAERERQASAAVTHVEPGISAATGSKTVIHVTAKPKIVTQRKGGRKPGSGTIDDRSALLSMLHLLAAGKASSVWYAAAACADGSDGIRRRLARKFGRKWGTSPPAG